jgi:hypothetical protein
MPTKPPDAPVSRNGARPRIALVPLAAVADPTTAPDVVRSEFTTLDDNGKFRYGFDLARLHLEHGEELQDPWARMGYAEGLIGTMVWLDRQDRMLLLLTRWFLACTDVLAGDKGVH